MKRVDINITVGPWFFDFVTECEIVSTWDTLTDICTINLPKNVVFKRDGEVLTNIIGGDDAIFNAGDQVVVKAGYDGELKTRFMGRLMDVKPRRPLELICEDEMYILKQSFIDRTINLKKTTLRALIDELLLYVDIFLPDDFRIIQDIEIGDVTVKNTSVAKVFDWLRRKLGIVTYFRPNFDENNDPAPILVSGLAYDTDDNYGIKREVNDQGVTTISSSGLNSDKQVKFVFGKNIISDDDLEIRRDDNQKILVIGKSKQSDNTVLVSEAGDRGGEVQLINFPELTQDQLDQFVQDRLSKIKYTGFSGSFNAFLEPATFHGDVVNYNNSDIPEKNGVYLVKLVRTTIGTSNGGKQVITLENRLSDA